MILSRYYCEFVLPSGATLDEMGCKYSDSCIALHCAGRLTTKAMSKLYWEP